MWHIPVLLKETIEILDPKAGEFFIDGTLGGGGHALEIIKRIEPDGTFLGIDWDKEAIKRAGLRIKNLKLRRLILVNDNFRNLSAILQKKKLPKADGLLFDLGFSSNQTETSGRGFSFLRDERLIMTYGEDQKPVYRWLEELNERQLSEIIKNFGEERCAESIARAIKRNLPIRTTGKLAAVIKNAVPKNYEHGRLHPATRTFLALRIFANQEFVNLKAVLNNLLRIIKPGGRAAIISFNSLEDRFVKQSFATLVKVEKAIFLNKKPIVPTKSEIYENPRSRSAKIRGIKII